VACGATAERVHVICQLIVIGLDHSPSISMGREILPLAIDGSIDRFAAVEKAFRHSLLDWRLFFQIHFLFFSFHSPFSPSDIGFI
jgi:hypothetical protein